MPKFKDYNQKQTMLLPPDIRDIIHSDHICYIINDVVDNLDISPGEKTKIINQRYFCEDCAGCRAKAKCTAAKNKQICIDWELEKQKEKMRAKLNTGEGRQKYLERMYDVEPVFGNIKYNQKMENFPDLSHLV